MGPMEKKRKEKLEHGWGWRKGEVITPKKGQKMGTIQVTAKVCREYSALGGWGAKIGE